jgi:hypothetical protein
LGKFAPNPPQPLPAIRGRKEERKGRRRKEKKRGRI